MGFTIGMVLAVFYKSSDTSHDNLSNFCLSLQEKKRKIDFQDGRYGGHLGVPIGTSLTIFDLQVALILPTKFRVN